MKWEVGQTVMVQSRTWANINKPGGCAKIVKVHYSIDDDGEDSSYVEGLDVKYILGLGGEKNLDPAIVSPFEELQRGGRSRRGRDFLMKEQEQQNVQPEQKRQQQSQPKKKAASKPLLPPPVLPIEPAAGSGATCSTPEPPRHARNNKKQKLPRKITPIPKTIVIPSDNSSKAFPDEISPMWMGGATSILSSERKYFKKKHPSNKKTKTSKSAAARGLNFEAQGDAENRVSTTLSSSSNSKKKQHQPLHPKAAPTLSTSTTTNNTTRIEQQQHHQQSTKKQSQDAPAAAPDSRNTAMQQQPARYKTKTNSIHLQSNKNHPSRKRKQGRLLSPRPIISSPTPHHHSSAAASSSFSRTTSKYAAAAAPLPQQAEEPCSRKPLLDVYRSEVEKARKFMDEMVGKPSAAINPRYEEFLTHLHKVWLRIDGEDEIDIPNFHKVFHEVTNHSFGQSEVEEHLEALCSEGNEVMKSDGMLYRIA